MEEVIRSSQEKQLSGSVKPVDNATPVKINPEADQIAEKIYTPKKLRTPTKSPKQKINKFSPIRHLQKRSRSNSSGRGFGNSPNKLPFSPSKSHFSSNSNSPSRQKSPKVKLFQDDVGNSSASPKKLFFGEPYYLKNFRTVVESVINDSHYDYLLHTEDRSIVDKFFNLSHPAKCLYVRLFLRKWDWKSASSIKYPIISDNLEPILLELHTTGFVIDIDGKLNQSNCKIIEICHVEK